MEVRFNLYICSNDLNLEKYDHNVMIAPLIHCFRKEKVHFNKMSCIKRGNGYMEIRYGNIIFRDMMNYTPPMSLG